MNGIISKEQYDHQRRPKRIIRCRHHHHHHQQQQQRNRFDSHSRRSILLSSSYSLSHRTNYTRLCCCWFSIINIIINVDRSKIRIDKRRSDEIMNDVKRVIDRISMEGIHNRSIPIIHRIFIFISMYTTTDIFINIIIRSIRCRRPTRIRTICRFGLFLFDDGSSCCC